ncbi:MAG: Cof-type HAD-IIB family hydrolase [Erysipelotrichaceae bacterium]|nr:Cof-type HAD-IIB family hydrolase [Erysipelotrichaceae bacterium]
MKLLATDYDGTLKFGDSVQEKDVKAIQEWRKAGNLFAIVTGRSKQSITRELEENNIEVDYFVTNNGGMVFDHKEEILLETTLDNITAIDLMYVSHEMPGVVSYTVNDGVNRHKVEVHPNLEEHRYANLKPDWTEEEIMDSGRFAQIVYSCSTPEYAEELAKNLNAHFGDIVTAFANNFVVDIVPKGINKASGIDFVSAYAGVNDDEVYCIGDSHNDVPMLEACDNSAAVSMAHANVKEAAHYEFDSVADYIAFAMER